jgi:hypothetical protein
MKSLLAALVLLFVACKPAFVPLPEPPKPPFPDTAYNRWMEHQNACKQCGSIESLEPLCEEGFKLVQAAAREESEWNATHPAGAAWHRHQEECTDCSMTAGVCKVGIPLYKASLLENP